MNLDLSEEGLKITSINKAENQKDTLSSSVKIVLPKRALLGIEKPLLERVEPEAKTLSASKSSYESMIKSWFFSTPSSQPKFTNPKDLGY